MFASAASRRKGEELLTQMSVSAASSSAAFTGNSKPLEGIEKAIRGESLNYGSEIQQRLKGFARKAGVRMQRGVDKRR